MKVRITIDVDDKVRRAINARFGDQGLASRAEILMEIITIISTAFDDYVYEMEDDEKFEYITNKLIEKCHVKKK